MSPYREAIPRPDPAPRMRWALRRGVDDFARGLSAVLTLTAMVVWSMFYIGCGLSREVVRGAEVVAAFALAWALVFVTRERAP